jgi:hypothetical protein
MKKVKELENSLYNSPDIGESYIYNEGKKELAKRVGIHAGVAAGVGTAFAAGRALGKRKERKRQQEETTSY